MYIRSRLMAHELRPWQSRMLVKVWNVLSAYFQLESSPAMGDQEGITMESHNKSNKPTKHRKHARKQAASKQHEQKANDPRNTETKWNKRHNISSERGLPQVLGYPHLSMALEIGGIYTRAELESRCSGTSERKHQLVPRLVDTTPILPKQSLQTSMFNTGVVFASCGWDHVWPYLIYCIYICIPWQWSSYQLRFVLCCAKTLFPGGRIARNY